ncbi:MAG: hypothetical protein RX316_05210 [bacterium]|nr:hypothetical protein [bacterium]
MPAGSEFQRKLRGQDERLVAALERIARSLERLVDAQEIRRQTYKPREGGSSMDTGRKRK